MRLSKAKKHNNNEASNTKEAQFLLKIAHISHHSLVLFSFLLVFLFCKPSLATRQIKEVDYFASLRSNETNVRSGPGKNYPIKFTFYLRSLPVRVISEYDNWSEIKDYEGQSGWIMQNLLTKRRSLMIRTTEPFVNMHSKNSKKSHIILRLEKNVIGDYLKCIKDWCALKIKNKKGWVLRSNVFGDK